MDVVAAKRPKGAIRLKTKAKPAVVGEEVTLEVKSETTAEQAIIDETKPIDETLIKALSSDISESIAAVTTEQTVDDDEHKTVSEITSSKIAGIVEVPKTTTTPTDTKPLSTQPLTKPELITETSVSVCLTRDS